MLPWVQSSRFSEVSNYMITLFRKIQSWRRHLRRLTWNSTYSRIADLRAQRPAYETLIINVFREIPEASTICVLCSIQFEDITDLSAHFREKHVHEFDFTDQNADKAEADGRFCVMTVSILRSTFELVKTSFLMFQLWTSSTITCFTLWILKMM